MFLVGLELDLGVLRSRVADGRHLARQHRRAVRAGRLAGLVALPRLAPATFRSRRSRCSWACRCRSPPSRCWRAFSPTGACNARRWARRPDLRRHRRRDRLVPAGVRRRRDAGNDRMRPSRPSLLTAAYIALMLPLAARYGRGRRRLDASARIGERRPGAGARSAAAVGAGHRVHRHPRHLRRVPAGHDHPARKRVARHVTRTLEDLVRVLLLPAFFAFTGMRTQIGLVHHSDDWLICGLIIVVATAGKFGGTLLGAAAGLGWRDRRGAGRPDEHARPDGADRAQHRPRPGRDPPTLFAMLVMMALVTTIMTSPILSRLLRSRPWTVAD